MLTDILEKIFCWDAEVNDPNKALLIYHERNSTIVKFIDGSRRRSELLHNKFSIIILRPVNDDF